MSETPPFVLAVDVGTSSLKTVLYGISGEILGTATSRYSYQTPQPDWAEADPENWWQAFCSAMDELSGRGWTLDACQALAFTGQMHTGVLLDEENQPLAPTILWLDRRASLETEELQKRWNLPPYQLNSTYTLPKLLWLARHNPEVIIKARKLLWPKDYLRFRLTGRALTDLTEAGGAALLNWETLDWACERLTQIGMDPSILPELKRPEQDAGPLLPEMAARFGFSEQVKVITGAGDVLALTTAAPPAPRRLSCSLGSSSMVFLPLLDGKEVRDPLQRIYTYPLLAYPLLGGVTSTTGAALNWAWQTIFPAETSFEQAVASAVAAPPGSSGIIFLPFLSGERSPYWSDQLRGSFYGLSLAHTRQTLLRSVMEGVGFSLRMLVEIYQELGFHVEEIALAGGGAVTEGWPQILADICQMPVLLYSAQETVTRALYAYACQAVGMDQDFRNALQRTFGSCSRITPNQDLREMVDRQYQTYKRLAEFSNQLSKSR